MGSREERRRMTPEDLRRLALALPEACEGAHMTRPDFRVGGRIFATLWPQEGRGVVKLDPEDQRMRVEAEPGVFARVPSRWGLQGWTSIDLASSDEPTLKSALLAAWRTVAPKRLIASGRG